MREPTSAVSKDQRGFSLVAVLFMLLVLLSLVGAYSTLTRFELGNNKLSSDFTNGFYAAEAGLNLRAENIRDVFVGYNRPTGTSPTTTQACQGSNLGTGDFDCRTFDLAQHRATTWVNEEPGNPLMLTIPLGERYQNLTAQEYRYTSLAKALNPSEQVEAILELRFKSRLVPLFQFAAFYNKDLEILPGPYMNLNGPVHTNGDLYLNANTKLEIAGQVTTAGDLYRGRKDDSSCMSVPVDIKDPASYRTLLASCPSRTKLQASALTQWNGMIQVKVPVVTVPDPEALDPTPGQIYWSKADLRLVLRLKANNTPDTANSVTGVEVRKPDDTVDTALTPKLHDTTKCPGGISGRAVGTTNTFYNNREGGTQRMLDVDMLALLNCIHKQQLFGASKTLNDNTEGGIVLYLTTKGPNSGVQKSFYGVRVKNGAKLQSNVSGAPAVRGITVVSDQAIFSWGNYNSTNKVPAAFLGDSYNVLSNAWLDANSSWSARTPSDTTVYAAILAGTDSTGAKEGTAGQGKGIYNGGLENYPRFHEDWSKNANTFTYSGSLVSLNTPRHAGGTWFYGNPQYTAPKRVWTYDSSFNNAANLPPLTPRFVYLRQQLFLRDYQQ